MSRITFGSGTFIRIGDPIPEFDVGGFTDEADEEAIKAIAKTAEATLTIEMNLDKRKLLRLLYGGPRRWPVSNNWLKMHGEPMRRNVQTRRAVRLVNYHHCEYCRQGDCDSFECLPGCHYPAFHRGDCADDCEHYGKCESCWYWWNEHKGWKCPFNR